MKMVLNDCQCVRGAWRRQFTRRIRRRAQETRTQTSTLTTWICFVNARRPIARASAGQLWTGKAFQPNCARTDETPTPHWAPVCEHWRHCRTGRRDIRSSALVRTTHELGWRRRCESSACLVQRMRWTREEADQGHGLDDESDCEGERQHQCHQQTRRDERVEGHRLVPDDECHRPACRLAGVCAGCPKDRDMTCSRHTWRWNSAEDCRPDTHTRARGVQSRRFYFYLFSKCA